MRVGLCVGLGLFFIGAVIAKWLIISTAIVGVVISLAIEILSEY